MADDTDAGTLGKAPTLPQDRRTGGSMVQRAHPPAGTPTRYPYTPGYEPKPPNPKNLRAIRKREAERKRLGREGTVALGARRILTYQVREMVELAGDTVRANIAGDEAFVVEFCDMLKFGASKQVMDKTCIRAVLDIMKLVSPQTMLDEFIRRMGALDESDMARKLAAYDAAGDADTLTALERMTTAMEALLPLHEEHRAMIIRRLGGILPREGEIG